MGTRTVELEEMMVAELLGWAARQAGADYLSVRELGDGRAVYLCDMLLGNLRLAIGEVGDCGYRDVWCYQAEQTQAAWCAALGWDGEGEPEGWYRHPTTGRRRPGGDAAQEHRYW
jgi:hypothetical protein